jgi:hypothetical protein
MDTIKKLITELISLLTQYLAQKPELPLTAETPPKHGATGAYILARVFPTKGRELENKMIEFLLAKLEGNGLFVDAVKKKDARTIFLLAAEACVGIRESGGNNKGPLVELMQKTIGGASAEAWCMSGVQTWLGFAEYCTGVKSPVAVSEHCLTVWNNTPKEQRVKSIPGPGAIAIWRHGLTQSGHTGVVRAWLEKIFKAVEANTESGLKSNGAVVRDGGGVYDTERSSSGSGSMKLVGFLKPF